MVKVATIINTHGLKGECKLYLFTDDVQDRFKKGRKLYIDENNYLTVQSFRMQKGFGYAKFAEVPSIDEAEKLKQTVLWIKEEDLPSLEPGHYYYFELMHCRVFNTQHEDLGEVIDILETGANLVFRIGDENKNFLCPYVPTFIESVDIPNKTIVIKEMEGLR